MPVIHIPRDPSKRQLAVFAAGWAVVFGLLGVVLYWRGAEGFWAVLCWAAGLAVPIAGACSRRALRWIYLAALYAAFPFGWVLSHVVLAVVYYGLLTPAGLLMRLAGKPAGSGLAAGERAVARALLPPVLSSCRETSLHRRPCLRKKTGAASARPGARAAPVHGGKLQPGSCKCLRVKRAVGLPAAACRAEASRTRIDQATAWRS